MRFCWAWICAKKCAFDAIHLPVYAAKRASFQIEDHVIAVFDAPTDPRI